MEKDEVPSRPMTMAQKADRLEMLKLMAQNPEIRQLMYQAMSATTPKPLLR